LDLGSENSFVENAAKANMASHGRIILQNITKSLWYSSVRQRTQGVNSHRPHCGSGSKRSLTDPRPSEGSARPWVFFNVHYEPEHPWCVTQL